MKKYILCFSILTSAACSTLGLSKASEENFRNVKVGQTKEQVKAQLGDPESMRTNPKGEIWTYKIEADTVDSYDPYALQFEGDRLTEIRFDTLATKEATALRQDRLKSNQTCNVSSLPDHPDRADSAKSPPNTTCESAPPLH